VPYNGSAEHKAAIHKALCALKDKGLQISPLADAITKAWASGHIPEAGGPKTVTRQLLRGWIARPDADKHDDLARAVYNFLEISPIYETEHIGGPTSLGIDSAIHLANWLRRLLGSFSALRDQDMAGLVGDFALFRPAKPATGSPRYVRSILRITKEYNSFAVRDAESHFDTATKVHSSEESFGHLVPFGQGIFSIMTSRSGGMLRFLTIHDFSPYMYSGNNFDTFKGTILSIAGIGPYTAVPVIARRIMDEMYDSSVILEEDLDEVCTEYFRENGKIRL
jgi:hypothetical protein